MKKYSVSSSQTFLVVAALLISFGLTPFTPMALAEGTEKASPVGDEAHVTFHKGVTEVGDEWKLDYGEAAQFKEGDSEAIIVGIYCDEGEVGFFVPRNGAFASLPVVSLPSCLKNIEKSAFGSVKIPNIDTAAIDQYNSQDSETKKEDPAGKGTGQITDFSVSEGRVKGTFRCQCFDDKQQSVWVEGNFDLAIEEPKDE